MPYILYLVPSVFLILFLLERLLPLRRAKSRLGSRLVVNAVVSSLGIAVALTVVRPVATAVLEFVSERSWGLASIMSTSSGVQAVIAFLMMDLTFYYWHRANHAWPFLWRFHNAHHVDNDLDVSTAVRFHFVEIGYSAAFQAQGPASIAAHQSTVEKSPAYVPGSVRLLGSRKSRTDYFHYWPANPIRQTLLHIEGVVSCAISDNCYYRESGSGAKRAPVGPKRSVDYLSTNVCFRLSAAGQGSPPNDSNCRHRTLTVP